MMKKRMNSRISVAKDRRQIQNPPLRSSFYRVPSSLNCPRSRISHDTEDTSRGKGVRFADVKTVHEISGKPGTSSGADKSSLTWSFDNPKTSEYQYCKKLLEDATRNICSSLPHKQDIRRKKIKARGAGNSQISEFEDRKILREDASSSLHSCLPQMQGSHLEMYEASNCMGVDDPKISECQYFKKSWEDLHGVCSYVPQKQGNCLKKIGVSNHASEPCKLVRQKHDMSGSLSPIEKAIPIELKSHSLAAGALRSSELQYKHGEIFSSKRLKLLELAAEALSVDVNEFSSKGSYLLSEFLRRLRVESNASNTGTMSSSKWMELDSKSPLLISPDPATHVDEYDRTPKRFLLPSTAVHVTRKDFPDCWVAQAGKLIQLPWNSPDFPTDSDGHEMGQPYKSGGFYNVLHGGTVSNLHDEGNLSSDIDDSTDILDRSQHFTLDHVLAKSYCVTHNILSSSGHSPDQAFLLKGTSGFTELDEMYVRNEPVLTKDHSALQILHWDNNNSVYEPELSIASCRTGLNLHSMASDHWWGFDSSLNDIASYSPPLFPNLHPAGTYGLLSNHYYWKIHP